MAATRNVGGGCPLFIPWLSFLSVECVPLHFYLSMLPSLSCQCLSFGCRWWTCDDALQVHVRLILLFLFVLVPAIITFSLLKPKCREHCHVFSSVFSSVTQVQDSFFTVYHLARFLHVNYILNPCIFFSTFLICLTFCIIFFPLPVMRITCVIKNTN